MTLRTPLAMIALLALAACDNSSAVETRDRTADTIRPIALSSTTTGTDDAAQAEAKPVLTAARRETVDAKIARLYARNGADFGAASAEDYLAKVTAFTARPPPSVRPSRSRPWSA